MKQEIIVAFSRMSHKIKLVYITGQNLCFNILPPLLIADDFVDDILVEVCGTIVVVDVRGI